MRHSLLNYLVCTHCHGDLTCLVGRERSAPMPAVTFAPFDRVPSPGAFAGPLPPATGDSPLTPLLRPHAGTPAPPERNFEVDLEEGLLVCVGCGRWYPVIDSIPEMLPDHLRDSGRDAETLARAAAWLPEGLAAHLEAHRPARALADDAGAHYKTAEISIQTKISDPIFFGPGFSAPFNLFNPSFTTYLIRVFANVMPLLDLAGGDPVLDSGSGYSWTTEWLFKSGFEAIGVDICRIYLEIGIHRMGQVRPHLAIADVEHLPLRDASVRAVLAYDSFHHVPDRAHAMAGFCRVLQAGRPVVLAEPGAAHEEAPASIDAMTKYGILEKGMELEDVRKYVDGLPFDAPEQHYVLRLARPELNCVLDLVFAQRHAVIEGNVFRIRKVEPDSRANQVTIPRKRIRRMIWARLKRYTRVAAARLGLE
jgi:uncharacterized protein YbaR (Trm112 family)/SAM-dependent methyltransferase